MTNKGDRNQLNQACQNLDGSENLLEKVSENICSNLGNTCHLKIYLNLLNTLNLLLYIFFKA